MSKYSYMVMDIVLGMEQVLERMIMVIVIVINQKIKLFCVCLINNVRKIMFFKILYVEFWDGE